MENVREILIDKLDFAGYKELFNSHLAWSMENNRISGVPRFWEVAGSINVFGFRCNTEADFNFGKYNDYLVIIKNNPSGSYDQVLINVTVDPNRDKEGIAHLRQGVWNSYSIRAHKHEERYFPSVKKTFNRWAICQDLNPVEIVRTDGSGKVIKTVRGQFGINIHDNGGYADSSLGCTVIQTEKDYIKKFLPYVYDLENEKPVPVNWKNITYCLINHSQLEKYLQTTLKREERADAVNGTEGDNSGSSMSATKIIS